MTPILREEVRAIDADLPLFGIRTMDDALAQARWPFRIFGTMFAIFALIALALSAVGLYAVTAYAVSQRTQEIGVRMALGAQGNEVAWLFLRRSFVQLAIGLTLGVAGAFGVGTLFSQTQLLVQNSGRRSDHDRRHRAAARARRQRGVLLAGATRDAARSADRAAARLGRTGEAQIQTHALECSRDGRAASLVGSSAISRATIPVTFATAKLSPFRFLSGGTPGIGRGKPEARNDAPSAIQAIEPASVARHRPVERHRPHAGKRSRQPAHAVLLARGDHDRAGVAQPLDHVGQRRFVIGDSACRG